MSMPFYTYSNINVYSPISNPGDGDGDKTQADTCSANHAPMSEPFLGALVELQTDEIEKASSKLSQTGAELARAQSALESLEATLRRKIQEYDTRLEEMDESEDRIKEYEEQLQLQQLEIARLEGELAMVRVGM